MTQRPQLVALPGYADRQPDVHFCGHCGRAAVIDIAAPASRVCGRCELGLLIGAPPELAPAPSDPFLLVDSTLAVCGMSALAAAALMALTACGPKQGADPAPSTATSTSCSSRPTPRRPAPATSSTS